MRSPSIFIKALLFFILILTVFNQNLFSQTFWYWTNKGGDNLWSNPDNWDDGVGSTGIPIDGDFAIFDPAFTTDNCTVNSTGYSYGAVMMVSGYTGTVTLSANMTIKDSLVVEDGTFIQNKILTVQHPTNDNGLLRISGGAFTQANQITLGTNGAGSFIISSGSFTGGSSPIYVNGTYTQSGGTFTSTSGALNVRTGDFNLTGGTFDHNFGTVFFNNYFNSSITQTIRNSPVFYNMQIGSTASNSNSYTFVVQSSITVTNLTINSGTGASTKSITINTGTILVEGNLVIGGNSTSTSGGGTATIKMNGGSDQSINGRTNRTYGKLCNVELANATRNIYMTATNKFLNVGGNLIKSGSGDITISGGEFYCQGNTSVTGGILRLATTCILDIQGNLSVSSGATLTMNTNAAGNVGSLLTSGSITNSGTNSIQKYILADSWHYISSPVSGLYSGNFSGTAIYYYNESSATWSPITNGSTQLNAMKGYDLYAISTDRTISFGGGSFNTGSYSISVTAGNDGFNLVGNPYPSTIDWDASSGWTKTNVDDATWVWRGTYISAYGTGAGVGTMDGSRYIPATQGFFVKASGSGTLGVTNDVRSKVISTPYRSNPNVKDVLRIRVNSNGIPDEAVVLFRQDASQGLDEIDVDKMFNPNSASPQIYTKADATDICINALPFKNTTIPVYFKPGSPLEYTLKLTFDQFNTIMDVFVEDLKEHKVYNAREFSEYTFTSTSDDNPERFLIHITMPEEISNGNFNSTINLPDNKVLSGVKIYTSEDQLIVTNCPDGELTIFDIVGKEVFAETVEHQDIYRISLGLKPGTYIVKISGDDGICEEKIVVN